MTATKCKYSKDLTCKYKLININNWIDYITIKGLGFLITYFNNIVIESIMMDMKKKTFYNIKINF